MNIDFLQMYWIEAYLPIIIRYEFSPLVITNIWMVTAQSDNSTAPARYDKIMRDVQFQTYAYLCTKCNLSQNLHVAVELTLTRTTSNNEHAFYSKQEPKRNIFSYANIVFIHTAVRGTSVIDPQFKQLCSRWKLVLAFFVRCITI